MRIHWERALLPPRADSLVSSLPDVLAHVGRCLPHDEALVVWDAAVRRSLATESELRRIRWVSPTHRQLAVETSRLSESIIETLAVDALRHAGIPVQQQVKPLGIPVDALVGERLVLQFDGQEFHAGALQRSFDAKHDARLVLDGFHVLRFTYADVVERRPELIDRVRRAIAQGLDRAH